MVWSLDKFDNRAGNPCFYAVFKDRKRLAFSAESNYFDSSTTGQTNGVGDNGSASGVTGETTAAMQSQTTYTGWDFTYTWNMASSKNGGFPYLRWQQFAAPSWAPPLLQAETVTVNGGPTEVIGNLGFNPVLAIINGTYVGYSEEHAAIVAGASFGGEGTNSAYMSAILDGSGVGQQQHVSAVQQGQFAALYQKLGIIPTWTNNTVSIPQGVAALVKAGSSPLAIENYLVQMDGFSWAAAQAQAQAGFPIQAP